MLLYKDFQISLCCNTAWQLFNSFIFKELLYVIHVKRAKKRGTFNTIFLNNSELEICGVLNWLPHVWSHPVLTLYTCWRQKFFLMYIYFKNSVCFLYDFLSYLYVAIIIIDIIFPSWFFFLSPTSSRPVFAVKLRFVGLYFLLICLG